MSKRGKSERRNVRLDPGGSVERRDGTSLNTLRMARARLRAAQALPDVLYQKKPALSTARPSPVKTAARDDASRDRRTVAAREARHGLTLEDRRKVCKSRPERSSGSGNGRPFVPWCDRK